MLILRRFKPFSLLYLYQHLTGKKLQYPLSDVFRSPAVYYCRHRVKELLKDGKNLISVALGNGWFNHRRWCEGEFFYGLPRLLFSLKITCWDGSVQEIHSDLDMVWASSHIIENSLYYGETQDLSRSIDFHSPDVCDDGWNPVNPAKAPEGRLRLQKCPPDKVIRTILPKLVYEQNNLQIYDLGENTAGRIVFDTRYKGKITLKYGERMADNKIDFSTTGIDTYQGRNELLIQTDTFYGDGRYHKNVYPHFSWHGFRYFSAEGKIENPVCQVIHSDVPVSSSFESEHEVLNQLYSCYIRTQLANIHGCVPSDCPHRERLGYTGDGQVVCETAMLLLDAKKVYEKWMQDIVDCQCKNSGHIQHTAPFSGGGGGPCGWGGAVVIVPYKFYKQYGDIGPAKKYYSNMCHWFEYAESRCEDQLVVREETDGWCLGDWSIPGYTAHDQKAFPAEFVNTYFLIKCYLYAIELEKAMGINQNTETFLTRIAKHKAALQSCYYDAHTGNFFQNRFGANAYAVDIGLGDSRTLENLICHYSTIKSFDTGIFGTEIVLRVLNEYNRTDIVFDMLTSRKEKASYGYMFDNGATAIWEYWDGSESQNQPMFGSAAKFLFLSLLGFKNAEAGWKKVIISPYNLDRLGSVSGSITTPNGILSASFRKRAAELEIPKDMEAELIYNNIQIKLKTGKNIINL